MSPLPLMVVALLSGLALAEPPDPGHQARAQAAAYLEQGNTLWAAKTLLERVQAAPDDAESRAWAAWVLLQDGDTYRAQRLLDAAPSSEESPAAARLALLQVALHQLAEQPDKAEPLLAELRREPALYGEDRAMLASMRQQILGDRGEPVSARVQLSGGYASNVVGSAPQDTGSGRKGDREAQAPVATVDAVLRFEPWTSPMVRPVAELRAKGSSPFTAETAAFGYITSGARAGVELGPAAGTRARLMYAPELMGLRGDPDPEALAVGEEPLEGGWIMETHRGDLEIDLGPTVQLFGGGGRRIYSELPRTRTELDLGGAWVVPLGKGWNIAALATGRKHWARHPGWDAHGATGLLRVAAPLPGDHMVKLLSMVTWDSWPDYQQWEPTVLERTDVAARLQVGPWTRSLDGWRFGLTYNLASRASSVDAYDYTDHRALLEVRWQGGGNPGAPAAAAVGPSHQPMPWGLDDGGDLGLDRVQDLLRQEDSARRGSSCAE
jgi:hypothetical protein